MAIDSVGGVRSSHFSKPSTAKIKNGSNQQRQANNLSAVTATATLNN